MNGPVIKKCQILLVEDDLTLGTLLKDYLELHNYGITLCADGVKGRQFAADRHFDLCILDVMVPKIDGWQLAREIRAENRSFLLFFSQQSV